MYLVKSPYIITELTSGFLTWKMKKREPAVFLTFDDGPVPEVTPEVLDILGRYQAKATFFMVGENAKRYPEIVNRILSEGHSIGNHTFNHLNGYKVENLKYYDNVQKAAEVIKSNLFRPPYGRIRKRQIQDLRKDYRIVLWSVLSGDFDTKISAEKCTKNVLKNTKNGSIVVFHDSLKAKPRMIPALEACLKHFSERGFKFRAIENQEEV